MLVELGNPTAHECVDSDGVHVHEPRDSPAVTYITIPDDVGADGNRLYDVTAGADVRDIALHLAQNGDLTRLPGQEALLSIVHTAGGLWAHHGAEKPSWVTVAGDDTAKADELERLISEFYNCARGRPDDVEDTHHTAAGPPGVGPVSEA